jgi:signal transduction histidine kinase/ActR/RegA family two-component response regulator
MLLDREQVASVETTAEQRRAEFSARLSVALAASLDYQETLQTVARLVVPDLADLCVVDLLDEGVIRRVAAVHADPHKADLTRELQSRFPPDVDGPHPVARVLRSGKPELSADLSSDDLATIARHPDHMRIAQALEYTAYLVVPLVAHGRTLGTMSLVSAGSGRRYSSTDVAFAEDVAQRAALAVDNARLFSESDARRREAETLREVGQRLSETLDQEAVGRVIVDSVQQLLQSKLAALYRLDPASGDLRLLAGAGAGVEWNEVLEGGTATVGLATHEGRPVMTADLLSDSRIVLPSEHRARIERSGYRAVLAVPLLVKHRVIGALSINDVGGRTFTADEIRILQTFAQQAALALENATLYADEHAARSAAEAANRTKDEFLATLSHELRTPLNAMLGWTRMLRTGTLDDATATRGLEVIERNVRLQAQLIDDLLDVSRIITGKLRLDRQPVDLVAIVDAAIEATAPGAAGKDIRVEARLDASVGLVEGDAARLQQIVWNLLSNAIKFTPKHGRVVIRLEQTHSSATISVSDTGSGIKPEFLPYIFERFRQADSTTTRTHGGLGLGLAIVRHLTEQHGGTVHAASPGLGQGATFTVRLPLLVARLDDAVFADDDLIAPLSRTEHLPRLDGVRVLVVDDEASARELVLTILRRCGAEVTLAASAEEALAALERLTPDAIVSDIAMPDRDGYSLIRAVRARPAERGGHVPAIALTAFAHPQARIDALTAGYQLYLTKPVEPVELALVVAHLAAAGA